MTFFLFFLVIVSYNVVTPTEKGNKKMKTSAITLKSLTTSLECSTAYFLINNNPDNFRDSKTAAKTEAKLHKINCLELSLKNKEEGLS